MLLIPCPHCGPRPEIEFRCGGEAHIARPADPAKVDDADWAQYLFFRANPKGVHAERWLHAHGCQRWLNALRDTASDRIVATYAMGAHRPAVPSTVVAPPTPNPCPRGGGEGR
jgi:sarcosine oxidase subunit delta